MSNVAQVLSANDLQDVTSTQQQDFGTVACTKDGRKFRYGKAGGTALAAGKLVVAADADANVVNKVVTAAAKIGSKQVALTAGGSVTANAYAGGVLQVNDATGEGYTYSVVGNTGGTNIVVTLGDPIQKALVASTSEVSLYKHECDGVVISATDQADLPVGVPVSDIPANSFGWFQVYGMAAVLADEAVTRGQSLTIGTGTAGAVEAADLIGEPQVGVAAQALIDTEYSPVFLTINS